MFRAVPSERLAPVQKTYWQDICNTIQSLENVNEPLRKQQRVAKRYCRGFLDLIALSIKAVAL